MKKLIEMVYPYVLSVIIFVLFKFAKNSLYQSKNINDALDAVITVSSLIIGFLGAVAAFMVVFWSYFALLKYLSAINFNIFELLGLWDIAPQLAILFVAFGTLIGVCGSAVSMRKHLQV